MCCDRCRCRDPRLPSRGRAHGNCRPPETRPRVRNPAAAADFRCDRRHTTRRRSLYCTGDPPRSEFLPTPPRRMPFDSCSRSRQVLALARERQGTGLSGREHEPTAAQASPGPSPLGAPAPDEVLVVVVGDAEVELALVEELLPVGVDLGEPRIFLRYLVVERERGVVGCVHDLG